MLSPKGASGRCGLITNELTRLVSIRQAVQAGQTAWLRAFIRLPFLPTSPVYT